ncbi:MAG: hypothetical protein ABIN25_10565 [Ginsengibacter sp.]
MNKRTIKKEHSSAMDGYKYYQPFINYVQIVSNYFVVTDKDDFLFFDP